MVPEIGDSATLTPEARTQATETDGLPDDELNGETNAKKKVCFLRRSIGT